ncbi:hypothetical protein [Congregibacter litoralis]|uniref:Uncharacterized protein n=1 Tax=Congregibacter litoralis KT71 TaxID=314285 RepID=A4AD64_9GAMM|nr:hypothetical protein [Congregibacter litoralis]EAQ96117.1 hypothetical protein KT71_08675 [Congregibacter litoralis KT71]
MNTSFLTRYRPAVEHYAPIATGLPAELKISDGPNGLETYYAPFEHINHSAKLVICGITPGKQQAELALLEASKHLKQGMSDEEACKAAKNTGSFAGAMRSNLTKMLDHIGMAQHLGISNCAELFTTRRDLVHYTSALRYPVFKNGENYSGSSAMVNTPYLRDQSITYITEEQEALPEALWLPLGSAVITLFEFLVREGVIADSRVLSGMPHASGANAERIAYFLGTKQKDQLSNKVNADTIDDGRSRLLKKLSLQ